MKETTVDYYVTYSTRSGERTVRVDADSAADARRQIERRGGYQGAPLNLRYDLVSLVSSRPPVSYRPARRRGSWA